MSKVLQQSLWPFFILGMIGAVVVDNVSKRTGALDIAYEKLIRIGNVVSTFNSGADSSLTPMLHSASYDATQIAKVQTTSSAEEVNRMLKDGFILIAVAAGVNELGEPYNLYSLGLTRS
ncbi:hypothetical protein NBRC116583_19740 [Arenicella sp. 4NH20-0111]|uniref:hypothetical protein n=1 Tax=Arenicella sp. 4NH20-0111 TaxID=3127648 RepID=UPI0031068D4A